MFILCANRGVKCSVIYIFFQGERVNKYINFKTLKKENFTMINRILIILYSINILWAINAFPGLITVHQPDGTPIQCNVKGDQWANWHETPDGWSITNLQARRWIKR